MQDTSYRRRCGHQPVPASASASARTEVRFQEAGQPARDTGSAAAVWTPVTLEAKAGYT